MTAPVICVAGPTASGKSALALDRDFAVEPAAGPVEPVPPHEFAMYLAGRWNRLVPRRAPAPEADPLDRLEEKILNDRQLETVHGIGDPRADPRVAFVGGVRGTAELERRVDGGEMAVAFALHPTSMADLMAVADAGRMMPPKCTWFEPKLADGLVSYVLD